jgi:signal transduction histidine kinase
VAIDILHNAGNALNSINVSVDLLAEQLRRSRRGAVAKLGEVLDGHAADLPRFLAEDPAGRKVPEYVRALGAALTAENEAMASELAQLREHVRKVAEIIDRQRLLASAPIAFEGVDLVEVVDDVLRDCEKSGQLNGVVIVRDYRAVPVVTTDRQKLSVILGHLLRNAAQACIASSQADKRIVVRITQETDWARILVSDNGVGIAPGQLGEIFRPDYPRRTGGIGTGLHADATAATELRGKLTAQSAGPGLGATFALQLPCPGATE